MERSGTGTEWERNEERRGGSKDATRQKSGEKKEEVRIKRQVKPHLGVYRYENYLYCTCDMKLQLQGEAREH